MKKIIEDIPKQYTVREIVFKLLGKSPSEYVNDTDVFKALQSLAFPKFKFPKRDRRRLIDLQQEFQTSGLKIIDEGLNSILRETQNNNPPIVDLQQGIILQGYSQGISCVSVEAKKLALAQYEKEYDDLKNPLHEIRKLKRDIEKIHSLQRGFASYRVGKLKTKLDSELLTTRNDNPNMEANKRRDLLENFCEEVSSILSETYKLALEQYEKEFNGLKEEAFETAIERLLSRDEFMIIRDQDALIKERYDRNPFWEETAMSEAAEAKNTRRINMKKKSLSIASTWKEIEEEYEITKRSFGKKINFVSDSFKREIIFRDIAHAYLLANQGFSKPAVVLAGSVIEELLRLSLKHKNIKPSKTNFESYINTCEQKGLIKKGIHGLSNSVRHFRNSVHLEKEKSKKNTISKATAIGVVSSIFTIVNDLEIVR